MTDNLPTIQNQSLVEAPPVSITEIKKQIQAIQLAMREVMIEGVHYGKIPGTDKNCLLKPGAEKLGMLFRLSPTFTEEIIELPNGHREVRFKCTLTSSSGAIVAQGVGLCTTMESKYRYRDSRRKCPRCGAETIMKSKEEWGGGYYCNSNKGGCSAKFPKGDQSIEAQVTGKVENPELADTYNTVYKMSKKRSHVDAMITATGASDIFSQDLEDNESSDASPKVPITANIKTVTINEETGEIIEPPIQAQPPPKPNPKDDYWSSFKYSYSLPREKKGWDFAEWREKIKQEGGKWRPAKNKDIKTGEINDIPGGNNQWYTNVFYPELKEYLKQGTAPATTFETDEIPAHWDNPIDINV